MSKKPPSRRRDRMPTSADKARIAITMDLEMSRHYPQRGVLEWDYCKGNLDEPTKKYATEVCRRVKAAGGVVHAFLLGRTLEQENVEWLERLVCDGHALGNHTYDHVKLNARKVETLQMRFRRCPWLIEGQTLRQAIVHNIRLTESAMQHRLGKTPDGIRTPYGFSSGLGTRQDLQTLLLTMGYRWVSSHYQQPRELKQCCPTPADFAAITRNVQQSQPYVYPTGLIELPLSPITDVNAFRSRRWTLASFQTAINRSLTWVIENRGVYDYCFHPSVMVVEDPEFQVIDLICETVRTAGHKAAIVDLDDIATYTEKTSHMNA